ncbi:MAG TPA: GNAT family N-acetyltransferase [Planctomycetota bacterium]|nr:GNAT family N-acetyltransferase [Planctomycetota bacterium]
MTAPMIETVLGPVSADRLGIVMPHEHFPHADAETEDLEAPPGYRQRLERWQREVIREAQGFGVGTVVELTPIGYLRMVPMMQRISRDTGVHVVASTGFYLEGRRPEWVKEKSAEDLAEVFVRELTRHMTGTDARAWMIKVGAYGKERWCEEDEKVFRAAAIASRETGAAVTTHSCNAVRHHFDCLVDAGADPSRLYIGHADLVDDPDEHLHVARCGGHLIFTCWGIQHFVDQDVLAGYVVNLAEAGFPDAVLLSIDYALKFSQNRMDLVSMEYECPCRTPGFLFRYALPKLREKGITDELIVHFTVENPRTMLVRPGGGPSAPASARERIEVRTGIEIRTFSDDMTCDIVRIVNAYTAGWPYSRPIGPDLVEYWKTLGDDFQPGNVLVALQGGEPRAFLHGERTKEQLDVHVLAAVPGAVEQAARLLEKAEERARAAGVPRLCGPTWRAWHFYNSYVLGHEAYHPHWERDATAAYVRRGFRISHPSVLMVAGLWKEVAAGDTPPGYEIDEAEPPTEFAARMFRYAATFEGKEVATCTGRLFAELSAPGGGPVGQLGFVGTDEDHRGRGLAQALVRASLVHLKNWGASECILATGLDNVPALRAYEKAGFERRYNLNEWSKDLTAARPAK